MSCFKEGANHTRGQGPGRGGRRSQLKAAARALLKGASGAAGDSAAKKSALMGRGGGGGFGGGATVDDTTPKPPKCVKRLRSLERMFKDQTTDSQALPMKIEYANCLSDNGKFKEALGVLIDILDERHEAKAQKTSSESIRDSFQDFGLAMGGGGGGGGGAKLCSAPVLCVQDIQDDEDDAEVEEMTLKAFKHYINTLAQATVDIANKSPVFLSQLNSNNSTSKSNQNTASPRWPSKEDHKPAGSVGTAATAAAGKTQFVDYVLHPGQITPCPWSCPHCSGVIIEPISLACGHTYCRECLHKMAKAANSSKRASCLKCGVLWFPAAEGTVKKRDPKLIPSGDSAADNAEAPAVPQEVDPTAPAAPAAATADEPGAPSLTNTGKVEPAKNPLEAFNRLKINVTVNRLVEKYWGKDMTSVEYRKKGNKYFKQNRPAEAIKAYTKAIDLASVPDQFSLSNRSNALSKLGEHEASLRDAEASVNARPDWPKGYFRKGAALRQLNRHQEAFVSMFQCVSIEKATKVDTQTAVTEAAKSLMTVLDKSRTQALADVAASATTTTGQSTSTTTARATQEIQRKPSSSSLSNLSVDSGFCSSSGAASHSSLTSLVTSSSSSTKSSCDVGGVAPSPGQGVVASRAPLCITELIDYAAQMWECQANLETLKTPKEKWFLQGVRTYQRPYRDIADEAVEKDDYDCPLCFRLYWQPIVTSCGHTYCKNCLEQALDHNPQCPQCRTSIRMPGHCGPDEVVPNEFVECSLRRLLANEYSERKEIHMAEIQNQDDEENNPGGGGGTDSQEGVDGGSSDECNGTLIPMFVCTIAAPNLPCPLHVFEPKYRLMVRRAMESGTRAFGMSCKISDDQPFADYGTMLEIRDVQYFGDGRSVIDTVGGRRFRVLSRSERDGYDTAKVVFIQDVMPKQEEIAAIQTLHDQTFWVAGRWFAQMSPSFKSGILTHYGNLPEPEVNYIQLPNGPSWIWWLLLILPISPQIQIQVLSTTSLKKRLEVMAYVLRLAGHREFRM